MVLVRFADRAVGLASTVILARLLLPSDFGLVALAVSMIALLDVIGELSVELVLIQKQTAERWHYDTAWTLNIIKGLVLAAVLVGISVPAAGFFGEPRVTAVVNWLAIAVVLAGFENIGVVNFRKDLQFHREFTYLTTGRVAATVITVAWAVAAPGPAALIAGTIARRLILLALSFSLQSYRPRLSLQAFGELFRFSRWVMLENILNAVRQRSSNLIIGRVAGAQALGLYALAYDVALMASSEIEQPIRRAVFPGYAKIASDPALLRRAFLDVFGMIAMLAAPLAAGMGLIAPVLVPLFLGPKWLESIPLIQILSLFGLVVVFGGGPRLIYLAVNKPYVATLVSAVDAALLVPLTVVGAVAWGVTGVAWAMVITASVTWLTSMWFVMKLLDVGVGQIGARLWRVVLAVLGMAASVRAIIAYWPAGHGVAAEGTLLALCVATGGFAYAMVLVVMWAVVGRPADAAEHHVVTAIRRAMLRILNTRRRRPEFPRTETTRCPEPSSGWRRP